MQHGDVCEFIARGSRRTPHFAGGSAFLGAHDLPSVYHCVHPVSGDVVSGICHRSCNLSACVFSVLHNAITGPAVANARNELFWQLLRVIWQVVAMIALIKYADRVASWLVKDMIPKEPASAVSEPTGTNEKNAN